MDGAGVHAGSCDELADTEEQIAIGRGDRDLRDLGETERPLYLRLERSPELAVVGLR